MRGCILRVGGQEFDVDAFLRMSALQPYSVMRKGEERAASSPEKRIQAYSGFKCQVSTCASDNLAGQVVDAAAFLQKHVNDFWKLAKLAGVQFKFLDFSYALRIEDGQLIYPRDYIPGGLLKSAGECGIGLRMTLQRVKSP